MATYDRPHLANVPRIESPGSSYVQYSSAAFAGTASAYQSLVQQPGKAGTGGKTRNVLKGPGSFAAAMTALGAQIQANAEQIVKEAAFAGLSQLVQRTPVKTGNARINWRVGFGSVSTNLIDRPGTGSRGTNASVATAKAMIDGANKIKAWRLKNGRILIANPVSYIFDLDKGTSRQAPSGMTAFALQAARNVMRRGNLLR